MKTSAAVDARDAKRRAAVWKMVGDICRAWDGVVDRPSFGNPALRAGPKQRPFVVLDRYRGESCLWVRVDPGRRAELLADPQFFKAPYDTAATALCRRLPGLRRAMLKSLIMYSYESVK